MALKTADQSGMWEVRIYLDADTGFWRWSASHTHQHLEPDCDSFGLCSTYEYAKLTAFAWCMTH
jgi:hypothetical protein